MPDRFFISMFLPEDQPDTTVYLVTDDITGRVREATHDLDDANAVASWLNGGLVYAGGEPVLI